MVNIKKIILKRLTVIFNGLRNFYKKLKIEILKNMEVMYLINSNIERYIYTYYI